MIDIMFSQLPTQGQSLAYLVMINTLTRKLYTELLNPTVDGRVQFGEVRNSETIKNALERMLSGSGLQNFHLIGDAEAGFSSPVVGAWLRQHGSDFTAVARQQSKYPNWMTQANAAAKSSAEHRKLAIVDRVIRTIRDIAFAQHWETISPAEMKYITREYNAAPHKTLSELMGFDVSPNMAQANTDLQAELREKINGKQNKILHTPGFLLEAGKRVKVFNYQDPIQKRRNAVLPGNWEV
jgi:hypothetical protein